MAAGGWSQIRAWGQRHGLALSLVVGAALRLIGIQSRALQYDDAFTMLLSQRSLVEIVQGTAADTMPPLFYFLLHFWMKLGQQIWLIRMLSVILSLLVIVVLYQLMRMWFDAAAASWAAFLAAISPLQIFHAQDIRMYALMTLGQVAFLWFFTRIWFAEEQQRASWKNWLGLAAAGWVAVYTHNLAIFALGIPDLFLILQRRWKLLLKLAAAQAVIGLGMLPWLVFLPGQLQKIQRAFWTPRPGLVEIFQSIIQFHAAMPLPPPLLIAAAVLSLQIGVMLVLETRRNGRGDAGVQFLALSVLLPPIALFGISYLMRPVFVTRGFLISALAYLALAGVIISRCWSRGPGKLIAGGLILAAALTLPSFYTFNTFPRSPYHEAAQAIRQELPSGWLVIHETKLSYFPMFVDAPDMPQTFLADAPGSANDTFALGTQQAMQLFPVQNLERAAEGHAGVVWVTFREVAEEYEQMGKNNPSLEWLNAHYRLDGQQTFEDLEVYRFEAVEGK